MSLPKLCVKRPITTIMMMLVVIFLGAISVFKLPIDLFPDIEKPYIVVTTKYKGVGPKEIEQLITKPMEETLGTMKNLKSIRSTSTEGKSVVIAELSYGVNMNYAALEAREKIDLLAWELPDGASNPKVQKINPNAKPIMRISIASENTEKMKKFADKKIKPKLERIEGVASVNIMGGKEKEIQVVLNRKKVEGYGLKVDYISDIIERQNLNWPGGTVKKGTQDLLIRTVGEFNDIEDIRDLPILLPNGGIVFLKEVADIDYVYKKEKSLVKTDGIKAINISIKKQSGANTVKIGEDIGKELRRIEEEFPDLKLHIVFDQSVVIKKLIKNIVNTVIVGGILAVAVLYVFLRNIRTTLIIGLSLPVSIIATFTMLYFKKITINMMTLGGLALSGGMLVDNSIVVLENIYRFRQLGYSTKEAAVKATEEVGLSVTASTLTTVAVFLPVIFLEGMIAKLFSTLALTVTFSLLASLVVALTVIPMLASKLLKVDEKHLHDSKESLEREVEKKGKGAFFKLFDSLFNKFVEGYKSKLRWGLSHRKTVMVIGLIVFIASCISLVFLDTGLFPKVDEGRFTIKASLPRGTKIDRTLEAVEEIETVIRKIPEIKTIHSIIGVSDNELANDSSGENTSEILVTTTGFNDRKRTIDEIVDEARSYLKDLAGVETRIEVNSMTDLMGDNKKPIEINVFSNDLGKLEKIGSEFQEIVKKVEGVKDISLSMKTGNPEVQIIVDRVKAAKFGLTAKSIGRYIQGNIVGIVSTKLKMDGNEIDIKIKGDKSFADNISNIDQITVYGEKDIKIPISKIADIKIDRSPAAIDREKQTRIVSITGNISGGDLGSIIKKIDNELKKYPLPDDVYYKFGGENEKIKKNFSDLSGAMIVAVVLVYMILASQFESLLNPFIIILSVPLAFGGGILGLLVFGQPLSVPAIIGSIVLSGVVVNDSILLIDYIDIRRKEGESREEAILSAGPIRLRPIIMTTITTVLGLVPMLVSRGSSTLAPMAAVVIGGLILADVLILMMIPVMYTIFDDISIKIKNKIEAI